MIRFLRLIVPELQIVLLAARMTARSFKSLPQRAPDADVEQAIQDNAVEAPQRRVLNSKGGRTF